MLHVIEHPTKGKLLLVPAPGGKLKLGVVSIVMMEKNKVVYGSLDCKEAGISIPTEILSIYGYPTRKKVELEGIIDNVNENTLKQLIKSGAKIVVVQEGTTGYPGIFENMTKDPNDMSILGEIAKLQNFFK